MTEPKLTRRADGWPVLEVHYTGVDWDAAIERGLRRFGLKDGECTVIALPEERTVSRRSGSFRSTNHPRARIGL